LGRNLRHNALLLHPVYDWPSSMKGRIKENIDIRLAQCDHFPLRPVLRRNSRQGELGGPYFDARRYGVPSPQVSLDPRDFTVSLARSHMRCGVACRLPQKITLNCCLHAHQLVISIVYASFRSSIWWPPASTPSPPRGKARGKRRSTRPYLTCPPCHVCLHARAC
jgi:hypothetical protein